MGENDLADAHQDASHECAMRARRAFFSMTASQTKKALASDPTTNIKNLMPRMFDTAMNDNGHDRRLRNYYIRHSWCVALTIG
jgi:hypothetical protein